ncbi:glycerophosphodiester phosphodiesterase [Metabacillus malikii]|uniref:Glycerophosphoryl diester phosphodiesterase n=1 Tax=Metabacillus malikii TaxID=1504265 RepID=A0ABT9ZI04_9BACI|nr:glycerophosphodiester phosphodiesterase [Metabacillus malikii]MDQ0231909.1 glycerophosphoryl diester phosphodiesterase [Metabacillus malikii]
MTNIFGHRGAAGHYPENTMISFMAAYEAGADGIELDVQMTKDGELVVIHDETIDRTTTGAGYVHTYTYKELSRFDASYTFSQYKGKATVPTLIEVLEWAKQKNIIVNVELKNGIIHYPGLEEKVIHLIEKLNMNKQVIISSFNHYSLVECKKISNNIEIAILYMEGLYQPWEYAKRLGADGIHPHFYAATREIITNSINNDVAIRTFTVNDDKLIQQLLNNQCSAIITDFPEKAVKLRDMLSRKA